MDNNILPIFSDFTQVKSVGNSLGIYSDIVFWLLCLLVGCIRSSYFGNISLTSILLYIVSSRLLVDEFQHLQFSFLNVTDLFLSFKE